MNRVGSQRQSKKRTYFSAANLVRTDVDFLKERRYFFQIKVIIRCTFTAADLCFHSLQQYWSLVFVRSVCQCYIRPKCFVMQTPCFPPLGRQFYARRRVLYRDGKVWECRDVISSVFMLCPRFFVLCSALLTCILFVFCTGYVWAG
jgi:hypothetical protein